MRMREGETWMDFMTRCALAHDTSMARAFLRALGVPVPLSRPKPGAIVSVDRFADMGSCMGQRYGVRM
ncbi:MAG: hypothetical protein IJ087_01615 [Eggerthellaceae bacterium]|nr:hypothetical protein [Eggerthellaceae bacterium]